MSLPHQLLIQIQDVKYAEYMNQGPGEQQKKELSQYVSVHQKLLVDQLIK